MIIVGGSFSERPWYLRGRTPGNDTHKGPVFGWRRLEQTPMFVHMYVPTLADLPPAIVFFAGFRVLIESLGRVYESSQGEPDELDGVTFVRVD